VKLSKNASQAIETAARIGGYAVLGSAGSALAWIAVSSLAIDHRRKLEPAIPGVEPERFASSIGEIAFYADTTGAGRPLLLIHSINAAASAREMKPLFERYRGVRPVYAIDLPGYGHSARVDQRYSPELFKQAIVEFIDQQIAGEHPVDVVALSLSSEFAALAALESPHSIRSITMISPTGFGGTTMSYSESRRKGLSVPFWSQAFYDLLTSRASIRYFLKKSFTGAVPDELVDYGYATSHQPGARFVPLYFLSGQLFTSEVMRRVYNSVAVPTLVLYDRDGYTSFENLEPFLRNHMNWVATRIGNTKGLPHWERLTDTASSLDYFWDETVPVIQSAMRRDTEHTSACATVK
jgi:pimeloyl-ACP methyl ester carboxylesterase